ncbi:hypothetical protein SBA4_670007 [Candidatus Sulfopaludibacter sp. SbA4]|nr:hypothetical protein SBA4_670007 [Candidatus Sulfopaludibacter sp. SbA4]
MATSSDNRISRTPGVCGGKACIAGHRVRVLDIVVWHEHQGLTPDEIVSHVPTYDHSRRRPRWPRILLRSH